MVLHGLGQGGMRRRLAARGETAAAVRQVILRLAKAFPRDAYQAPNVWPCCATLLPHIIEMRDRLHEDSSIPDLAGFLIAVGRYLHRRGAYAEAEPVLIQAIKRGRELLGPEHADVATACGSLASLYRDVGRFTEAAPLLRDAIALGEKTLGAEHPSIAIWLTDFACHCYEAGRYDEAEPLYKRAIAIGCKALGGEHFIVAFAVGSLARLYRATGRHGEADPLFRQAIKAGMAALSREYPAVVRELSRAADDSEGGKGPARDDGPFSREQPDVAMYLNKLAYLHRAIGRFAEAEPLLKAALAISERTLGREHHDVAVLLNSLGRLYCAAGRTEEAEPPLKEALAITEKLVGRDHPTFAVALYNLARTYRAMGRCVEAEAALREVVEISEHKVGQYSQLTARWRWVLATILFEMGCREEALEQASAAFNAHEKTLGAEHRWTLDSAQLLAALRTFGQNSEAGIPGLSRGHEPSADPQRAGAALGWAGPAGYRRTRHTNDRPARLQGRGGRLR